MAVAGANTLGQLPENVCGDEKLSNKDLFPAFLRTRPPDSQMVESILALLQHYDWNSSISVVVENTTNWQATALSLETRTGQKGNLFKRYRLCCALKQSCCYVAWSHDILEVRRRSDTALVLTIIQRLFIFLGEKISLRKFVQAIEDLEQWRANQYLIISFDLEAFSTSWSTNFLLPREIEKMMDENHNWDIVSVVTESRKFNAYSKLAPKYPHSKELRAKGTPRNIVIIRNIANEQLKSFTRRLRLFSSQKHPIDKDVVSLLPSSIYAAYAYDAIMVYTQALAFQVKKRGSNLFPPKPNSSIDVHKNVMVPFGFFRGTMFHPTAELNHTLHARFASSESNFENQVIYDVELLHDNVSMTVIMRVTNYPVHPNKMVDDWRMKVWNKSIKWTSSWTALDCENIGEIRQMRRLQHDNINPFICATAEPARICIITEFQSRKSLMDALSTTNNDLNCKLIASLASDLRCHGNLKSANCLLDSNWTLKISDFGLHKLRNAVKDPSKNERDHYFGPFAICYDLGDPARIINQIKHTVLGCQIPARLPIEFRLSSGLPYMFPCMVDCWIEDPNERPNFSSVLNYLTKQEGTSTDVTYKKTLVSEDVCIKVEKRALEEEIQKIDEVLHRIIPKSVANCLANGLPVEAELWENVTVFEADLVGFTEIASETTPLGVNDVYTLFDSIARGYDVCKIGTIGDAYIVVNSLSLGKNSAGEIASMSLEVVEKKKGSGIEHRGKPLVVRIGVHTGHLLTGVVGSNIMPTYSIFGDTVSEASRLESTISELRIQISEASYQELQKIVGYITEERIISFTSTDIYIGHSIDDDPSYPSSP
ncbi:hypothetical protein GHT06_017002 [Daphnia sinensis]|uniref:Guanylate cyclase domain-containing protein n=1 Tax=Daphnia sinensis TaxID=1820382 RepID=A0AAD5PVN8_9CRUS|nr:hypothetical protein GHT06_017002 [Daphnia sinensis]